MKKYFCFYCQQEIQPYKLLKWRFCRHCKRLITDNGEGFYRVCDSCGANIPTDAFRCPKCGTNTGLPQPPQTQMYSTANVWLNWLLRIALIILSLVISVGILYISFYLIFAVFVVGLAFYLFNLFMPRR